MDKDATKAIIIPIFLAALLILLASNGIAFFEQNETPFRKILRGLNILFCLFSLPTMWILAFGERNIAETVKEIPGIKLPLIFGSAIYILVYISADVFTKKTQP